MELLAPLSVEEVQAFLQAEPSATYKTVKAATVSKETGLQHHTVLISYEDLLTLLHAIESDEELTESILDHARYVTADIRKGATSSSKPIPYSRQIAAHIGAFGGPIPDSVATELRPAITSFIIHRLGNS